MRNREEIMEKVRVLSMTQAGAQRVAALCGLEMEVMLDIRGLLMQLAPQHGVEAPKMVRGLPGRNLSWPEASAAVLSSGGKAQAYRAGWPWASTARVYSGGGGAAHRRDGVRCRGVAVLPGRAGVRVVGGC